jgi:HK97 family phage prohead protease
MIEIRSSADDTAWTLTGLATTWGGSGYRVNDQLGEYVEVIGRGAFPGATSGRDVVELRVEHRHDGPPIAATGRSGTMRLSDVPEGLLLTATLPKSDPDCMAAVSKAQRQLLDRLSIGFRNATSTWNAERSRRTVTSATLAEVSLVHRPANPAAIVTTVRGEIPDGELEVRFGPAVTVIEGRRDYTDAQKAALGKDGKAIWLDGHWAFPVNGKADFDDAVTSVGRTPGKNRLKVRIFLIGLAKKNGWDYPASWATDGTTNATPRSLPSFEENELVLRSLQYASGQRAADLRLSTELASPDARLARAVAASRKTELALELLLAKGKRR